MEAYEYQTMFVHEGEYWWYRSLHEILQMQVIHTVGSQTGRVLDAGCGTGQNLTNLKKVLDAQYFACDYSHYAMPFLKKRGVSSLCRASVNELPYTGESFDLVLCIDVLESQAVNVRQALTSLCRVTKPGGHLLLVVPAYELLKSPEHHQAVHADKRFTIKRFMGFANGLPLTPIRQTYLFATLFPAIAIYRVWQRLFPSRNEQARSELHALPGWINSLLIQIMKIEITFLHTINLPFGSSILLHYRKDPF